MSSSDSRSVTSDSVEDLDPSERSLAQRMILHVYNHSAIAAARQLCFWEEFRGENPDVEMPTRDLRAMFFGEVLQEPEHFDDLSYEITQYLNPRFNQFQLEALEYGDLIEGEDFLLNVPQASAEGGLDFDELVGYITTPFEAGRTLELPPLNVQLVHGSAPEPEPKSSSSAAAADEDQQMQQQFARLLSELLWTSDEAIEKPTFEPAELRARVLAVTMAGLSLAELAEPGTGAHKVLCRAASDSATPSTPKQKQQQQDQVVPAAAAAVKQSTAKRWKSCDDSGLGASPSKRSRLAAPGTAGVAGQKQQLHSRLRRMFSAPNGGGS